MSSEDDFPPTEIMDDFTDEEWDILERAGLSPDNYDEWDDFVNEARYWLESGGFPSTAPMHFLDYGDFTFSEYHTLIDNGISPDSYSSREEFCEDGRNFLSSLK